MGNLALKQVTADADVRPSDLHTANAFLAALTELSIQHGVAIGGSPVLFMMEADDHNSTYTIDGESNLTFG